MKEVMTENEKIEQSRIDKAIAARTIRVERAVNGFILKRVDGHYIYSTWEEASKAVGLYFEGGK